MPQQTFDLDKVIEIVSGVKPDQVHDCLFTSLRVHTEVRVQRRVDTPQKREVGRATGFEQLKGLERVRVAVAERRGPRVLVEGLERDTVRRDDGPEPPSRHDLAIRQMGDNLHR